LRSTYIHDTLGLTAASLRIISHRMLVTPINGPTIELVEANMQCPIKKSSLRPQPVACEMP
jgi:hypothetical protein